MKCSLIIPTYNKVTRLRLTLLGLQHVESLNEVELIFVDDGSTDETLGVLEEFATDLRQAGHPSIHVLSGVNSGRSGARNLGAKKARGEVLIFMDDDLLVHPNFIKAHFLRQQHSDQLVVHGAIFNLPFLKFFKDPVSGEPWEGQTIRKETLKYRLEPQLITEGRYDRLKEQARKTKFEKDIYELLSSTQQTAKKNGRWISCTGGNLSVRRDTFWNVGGFDTNMGKIWGCEDLELGYRLEQSGCSFVYDEHAVNYHMSHYRAQALLEHTRAIQAFYKKHADPDILLLHEYFEGRIPSLFELGREINRRSRDGNLGTLEGA